MFRASLFPWAFSLAAEIAIKHRLKYLMRSLLYARVCVCMCRASWCFTQRMKNIWINHECTDFPRNVPSSVIVTRSAEVLVESPSYRRIQFSWILSTLDISRGVIFSINQLFAFICLHCANFETAAYMLCIEILENKRFAALLQFLVRTGTKVRSNFLSLGICQCYTPLLFPFSTEKYIDTRYINLINRRAANL